MADTCDLLMFHRAFPEAIAPKRMTSGAAGYDLAAPAEVVINAGEQVSIDTGIQVAIPDGFAGKIEARSGLAVRSSVDKFAGLIDSDYRGSICVILFNHGKKELRIVARERIAQLVLIRIATPEVTEVAELPATVRGGAGFGSTDRVVAGSALIDRNIATTFKLGSINTKGFAVIGDREMNAHFELIKSSMGGVIEAHERLTAAANALSRADAITPVVFKHFGGQNVSAALGKLLNESALMISNFKILTADK